MAELSQLNVKITGDNTSLNTAVSQSMKLVDQFGREVTNSHKQAESAAAALTSEYRSLRASIDPLYANSKKYERQLAKLNALQKAGRISAGEFSRMNAQLSGSLIGAGNAVDIFNGQVRISRFHTGNLAAQFNDIGVMLASGQSPLVLAMQQGTQISQVFGAMGGTMKDNFSAIGQGLKQMVSPMALLTVGSIAAGAALFQFARKSLEARDNTNALEEAIKDINDELESGETKLIQYIEGFERLSSAAAFQELQTVQDRIEEITVRLNRANVAMAEWNQGGPGSNTVAILQEQLAVLREQEAELQKAIDANEEQAAQLDIIKERSERLLAVQQQLAELLGETDASNLLDSLDSVKAQFESIINLVTPFLDRLGKMGSQAEATRQIGIGKIADQYASYGQGRAAFEGRVQGGLGDITGGVATEEEETSTGGKASGGRRADQGAQELERLQTQLMSELEIEQENFAQRQTILDEALAKKRLSVEEHASLMEKIEKDHAEKTKTIDRAVWNAKMSGWAGAFGDLATLAQSENERIAKIGRAAAMIQIGIEGVQAASSAWQKGMEIGGPPVAAAFTAASVAKTAMLLSQVNSSRPNPSAGGGGGAATGGGQVTAPEQSQPTQRNFEFILIGDSFGRAQVEQVLRASIDAQDDGNLSVNIRGRR